MLKISKLRFLSTFPSNLAENLTASSPSTSKFATEKPKTIDDDISTAITKPYLKIRPKNLIKSSRPELDFDYLLNKSNLNEIRSNIQNRKQVGDIDRLHEIWDQLSLIINEQSADDKNARKRSKFDNNVHELSNLWSDFYEEARKIPNKTCPESPIGDETCAKIVGYNGRQLTVEETRVPRPRLAEDLMLASGQLRVDMGNECGDKCYALFDKAAILERCLIDYCVDLLKRHQFRHVVVPDVINIETARDCGMITHNAERAYVYRFRHWPDYCLSGTGEMGVASMLANTVRPADELPQKFYTVSRCFRPEVTSVGAEKLIYRVHEFTKVEMFAITANKNGQESDRMLSHFVDLQQEIFSSLNLHFKLIEMPSQELGAPAYRKFDIEAWMPGRGTYGEISSASNCTDYQSRRLLAKYKNEKTGRLKYVHTINGTACATTRLIIALMEQHQKHSSVINIPAPLKPYIDRYCPTDSKRFKVKIGKVHIRTRF